MSQLAETTDVFLDTLSSRAPTPGGGSGSAFVGAVAAALCGMVGRLNDKKSGEHGALHETIGPADQLLARMKHLVDADIDAFNSLMATWKMPPDDEEAQRRRQKATIHATEIPLEIMSAAHEIMQLAALGLDKSKKNCLSDAGVAAFIAHAALEGARLNVMINLPGITDSDTREGLRARSDNLRSEANALRQLIMKKVDDLYG